MIGSCPQCKGTTGIFKDIPAWHEPGCTWVKDIEEARAEALAAAVQLVEAAYGKIYFAPPPEPPDPAHRWTVTTAIATAAAAVAAMATVVVSILLAR